MVKINLDISLCGELRNKVNEHQHLIASNIHSIKNNDKNGWLRLCAILDRIEDSTLVLNTIDIHNTGRLSVFDFYNFMNISTTLLDSINYLAMIFDFDLTEENKKSTIFNKLGKDSKGNDNKYFKYLRALCSVHPIETSSHPEYQEGMESSPFLYWNSGLLDKKYELVAIVYPKNNLEQKYIGINISEIFNYIIYRYNLLDSIIKHIENYYQNIISSYRNIKLDTLDTFSTYNDYLDYLKSAYSERIDICCNEYFDFCKNVMNCKFSNRQNQEKLAKYQNVLKYGISFLHNYLQELPEKDTFETTGLKTQHLSMEDNSLFFELQSCNLCDYRLNHAYAFEKLSSIEVEQPYLDMAKDLFLQIKEIWEPYLEFEERMNSKQISVFLHVAIYYWRLDNDEWFKEQIPTEFK